VWLAGTLAIPRVANRPGRPQKQFSDASDRSKRRKTEDVRNSMDVELLIHATQLKLRSSGKRDASQVLKAITSSPTRATKYKKAFASQQEKIQTKMTSVSALAMFVEAGLSRRQYEIIRNTQKQIYPCYSSLQSAKIDCYPDKEAYRVTETCAEVELQNLLDHTVTRLLTYLEEIVQNLRRTKKAIRCCCYASGVVIDLNKRSASKNFRMTVIQILIYSKVLLCLCS
jgi:hypothetical protein